MNRAVVRNMRLIELYFEKDEERTGLCKAPLYVSPKEENKERYDELSREIAYILDQVGHAKN